MTYVGVRTNDKGMTEACVLIQTPRKDCALFTLQQVMGIWPSPCCSPKGSSELVERHVAQRFQLGRVVGQREVEFGVLYAPRTDGRPVVRLPHHKRVVRWA